MTSTEPARPWPRGLDALLAAGLGALQTLAFVGGFVSVVSFLWLAWSVGGYNAEVNRVFVADLVALGCLVVGAALSATLSLKTR